MSTTTGLTMGDDALVTFGPASTSGVMFHDSGYMPVTQESIGGHAIPLPKGETLFMSYNATGVQHFSAAGVPTTADYTSLHYDFYAGHGNGTFTHAANGTPTYSGLQNLVKLAEGDLIKDKGQLAFTPSGGIVGSISATVTAFGKPVGQVGISVQHLATDLGHTAAGGLTISGGSLHATFT